MASAAIDPTLLALLAAFGGALITGVAALVAASVHSKRDRDRWWSDQRAKVYADHLICVDRYFKAQVDAEVPEQVDPTHVAELLRTVATVDLFGPESVYVAAREFHQAMQRSAEHDAVIDDLERDRHEKRRAFIKAARAALK